MRRSSGRCPFAAGIWSGRIVGMIGISLGRCPVWIPEEEKEEEDESDDDTDAEDEGYCSDSETEL